MDAKTNISLVSNVWIKQVHFVKAGDIALSHSHTFDHQTLLAHGRIEVYVDDCSVRTFQAPAIIVVKGHTNHCLRALSDDTVVYCIHALRSSERVEDIVDPAHQVRLDGVYPIVDGDSNKVME